MVYLGLNALGQKVAVKVVRRDLALDPSFRARFDTEVANAQRVASFCTARVLDHGDAGGLPYLVTEYIEGLSLADYVESRGAVPAGPLRVLAVGTATALTAIHAVRLVHRDLKPRNVLLSPTGPRVIDFGIARALDSTAHHTQTGAVVGSPGWLAPEQLFDGQVSTAIDVFAWGTLIAYAASGRHPYGIGNLMVLAARAHQRGYDLRGVPAPLEPMIIAALEPAPANRPSAGEILNRLVGPANPVAAASDIISREWAPGHLLMPALGRPEAVRDITSGPGPPPGSPVGAGSDLRTTTRRRPRLVAVAAAVATVVVGGIGAGGIALRGAGGDGGEGGQDADARAVSASAQQITSVARPCDLVSPALLRQVSPQARVDARGNVGERDLGKDGAETQCTWGTLAYYRGDRDDEMVTHLIVKTIVRRDSAGRNGAQEAARDFADLRTKVQKTANTEDKGIAYGPFAYVGGIGDEAFVVSAIRDDSALSSGQAMVRLRFRNANVEVRYSIGYAPEHKEKVELDLAAVRDKARDTVEQVSRDVANNLATCKDCRT